MIKKLLIKLRLASQRCYGSNKIRYIYERHYNSESLVVVFSGFSAPDEPARFNYIRTLLPLKINKLFILDDFGYQNRGSYYLTGRQEKNNLQEEICSLITKYSERRKLITAGSSKGGTAALLYGLQCRADAVIVGAPQYHIGTYLTDPDHLKVLEGICGNTTAASVQKLDALLPDQIQQASTSTTVFIHCSVREHTFEDHVKDLLFDLKNRGFTVFQDLNDSYSDHAQVGQYYAAFLCKNLQHLTERSNDLGHEKKAYQ